MKTHPAPPLLNPHLPKVDLHRHLEGAVRLETVIELSQAHRLLSRLVTARAWSRSPASRPPRAIS